MSDQTNEEWSNELSKAINTNDVESVKILLEDVINGKQTLDEKVINENNTKYFLLKYCFIFLKYNIT